MSAGRALSVLVDVVATIGLAIPAQAWAGEPVGPQATSAPTRVQDSGSPVNAGPLTAVKPARMLDTRIGLGAATAAVAARQTVVVAVSGRGGIPASNVSFVRVNLTVTNPTSDGRVIGSAGRSAGHRPTTLPFHRGTTVRRRIVVALGADGTITLFNASPGTVQLIADVEGYYTVDSTPPQPVTAPVATGQSTSSVAVHWTNPLDKDFSGVMVRRSPGSNAPASAVDGTLVTDLGAPGNSVTDTGLTAGTQYSYALFAHDAVGNTALAAIGTATTKSAALRWSTPKRVDQDGGGLKASPVPPKHSAAPSMSTAM